MIQYRDIGRGTIFRYLMVLPVPWVFVLAYLAGVGLEFSFFGRGTSAAPKLVGAAGIVLFAVGAALAAWAWLIFRKARTTRVPGEASTTLVTCGPYHATRNPMYVGLAIAYLGEAGILKQVAPVAVLPFVIGYLNWIVIPIEEARLQQVFGDKYQQYRSKVRRWL
jgi:protein-S-isoprenylcysteine O-methyltransferase Ste14